MNNGYNTGSLQVTVLFFATLKDRAGTSRLTVEMPADSHVDELQTWLTERFPSARDFFPSCLVAVNHEYADRQTLLKDGDQVAFFPPVSGGIGSGTQFPEYFSVTTESLDLNLILEKITLPTTGAACIFSGMVRGQTRRGKVFETDYLEYEAYPEMAESKLRQVAREMRERWPEVEGIAIVQRIGVLQPGTPTVLVACSAGHRDSGVFDAAFYGIDRLKQIVPIWKKEVGPAGEIWVEGEYYPQAGE
jgi:molybdopterin synthase catalytic subunit